MQKIAFPLLSFILLMVPFLQLGISYYVSPQIVGFLGMVALVLFSRLDRRAVIFASICALIFLVKASLVFKISDIHNFLLVFREMLCFAVLLLAIRPVSFLYRQERIDTLYIRFLLMAAILVTLQHLAIANGRFVAFPYEWFVMNKGTLEGVELALHFESRLRPVGFYGEPSYMAFILTSAFVVFLSYVEKWKKILPIFVVNLFILALLGSLSGILAFMFIALVLIYLRLFSGGGPMKSANMLVVSVLILSLLYVSLLQGEFVSRLLTVFYSDEIDPSMYVRYVGPALLIGEMIIDGDWLVGYSGSEIYEHANSLNMGSIDNAALYLSLHYGFVAAPLFLAVLIYYVRHPLLIAYMLITLNFNGSYFSFDKAVVMALVLGLATGAIRHRQAQLKRAVNAI